MPLRFIRPGKLVDNAYVGSFHGRLRDGLLDQMWFVSLADARAHAEAWRRDYNDVRPHGGLAGSTPSAFAAPWRLAPSPDSQADRPSVRDHVIYLA